jgi:hypothetical protein
MNNRDALASGETEPRCHQCGQPLPGGMWFARIHRAGRTLLFCRPRCFELFLGDPSLASQERDRRRAVLG